MAERIEVNYESLERIRNSFAQQGQDVQTMTQKIKSQVDALRGGGWMGQGANAFYGEMDNDIFPALERLRKALEEADRVVAAIMAEFRNAEEETRSVWEPF